MTLPLSFPSLILSLLNFILFLGRSQSAYEEAGQNTQQCFPDMELLSLYQVKPQAQEHSGVVTWKHRMWVQS